MIIEFEFGQNTVNGQRLEEIFNLKFKIYSKNTRQHTTLEDQQQRAESRHVARHLIHHYSHNLKAAMAQMFNKEVAEYFFKKGPEYEEHGKKKNNWTCQSADFCGRLCCSTKNSYTLGVGAGFTNLRIHLKECVPEFESIYKNRAKGPVDIRYHVAVDKKTSNIFSWTEWIITENLPFTFLEKEIRSFSSRIKLPLRSLLIPVQLNRA